MLALNLYKAVTTILLNLCCWAPFFIKKQKLITLSEKFRLLIIISELIFVQKKMMSSFPIN